MATNNLGKTIESERKEQVFFEETLQAFEELGAALRSIITRLIDEGKVKVVNGRIVPSKAKR